MSYSPQKWQADRTDAWSSATSRQSTSHTQRVQAGRLVQSIDQTLSNAQSRVKADMATRISEIKKMEAKLEDTRDKVNTEMGRIVASIEELESHLAYLKAGPLPTCTENLKMRERRIGIDFVSDQVEAALNSEVSVVEDCMSRLSDAHTAANAELLQLKDTEVMLDGDLRDKSNAETIDVHTNTLKKKSAELGMFSETVNHQPSGGVDPQAWFSNSNANVEQALKEVAAAAALGARIHTTLDNCARANVAACTGTDRAFVSRLAEVNSAAQSDEAQIGRTRDEIAHQRKNIDILRAAIDAKNAPLQLATTRLATRAGRPGIERTSDAAHHALVDEAESLDTAISMLEMQHAAAEADFASLTDTLNELLNDLDTKQNSIRIDDACVGLRKLHSDRKPRKTEYHTARSANEWKHFGRTRCINI